MHLIYFDALNLISIDTNFFNKILNRIESKIFLSYSVDKLSNNSFKLYLKSSADVTSRETLARVAASLATLAASRRITLYAVESETFYEVANWSRHQRVDNAGKPKVPMPCDGKPVDPRETRGEPPQSAAGSGIRDQGDGTGNREQGGGKPPTHEVGTPEPAAPAKPQRRSRKLRRSTPKHGSSFTP